MLLHLAHMPLRLLGSCPPPASIGMMWSTCVDAALLHTVHMGCSRSMPPLFFRYSGCLCAWLIMHYRALSRLVAFVVGDVSYRAHLGCLCFVFNVSHVQIKPSAITPRALAS